ncbi:MAG: carboxypeptidase regulatory-like domain-containing protein [Candidatus Eisenbacteria bacterium]
MEVTPPSGPYLSEFFGGARTSDEAALVSATVPSERLDLDVDLDVGGEIDGRVRNETGSPYPDFEVEFEDRDRGTVFKTRTEDHGEYAMTGLPAGSYYVFVPRLNRYFPSAVHVEDARTVTVAEGAVAGRVDVIGFDLGDCRLSNDGRGVIHGVLDVDFAYTDAVVVTALSPSDTVETAFHDPGAYSLDCVPPGDYLVRFVAQGGYPRLFHPGVPDEAQAVRVTVAGDTAMAVDYLPDRSTWIAGRVLDAESNTPIGAVRVSARSTNGRVVASALTEADGFYRIETLPDGSGLPAGSYRVLAESTLVPDPDVTPVLQPTVSARQDGDQIRIAVGLAELGSWRVRVWRSTDPEEPGELVLDRMVSGAVGSVEILDRPPTSGTYRYALQADLLLDTGPEPLRAWSDPVAFARLVRVQVWAYPDPWSGVGAVRLRRSVSSERMQLAIISASGRRVASLDWPTNEVERVWNGTDSRGRPVPSGVYYLGLRDGTGRLLDGTTVVIGR